MKVSTTTAGWVLDEELTLTFAQWEAVSYTKDGTSIDFPGEYDRKWLSVIARATKAHTMGYKVSSEWKTYIFLTDVDCLESDHVVSCKKRYVLDESIQDVLIRRELEGELVVCEIV
jgi:hypothetical protein